jgi:hypothetical protein
MLSSAKIIRSLLIDGTMSIEMLVEIKWINVRRNTTVFSICCFLQQIEITVVLQRTFSHLTSTSIESHNGDNATKEYRDTGGIILTGE